MNTAKKSKVTARTKARSRAVDVLYEAAIKGLDDSAGIWGLSQERQGQSTAQTPIPPYSAQILDGISENLAVIDKALAKYAQGWTLQRMPAVDLAILRMGAWEILYNRDLDVPIVIDEALKVAKDKSTEKSPPFIHGLLAKIGELRDEIAPVFDSVTPADAIVENGQKSALGEDLQDAITRMLEESDD